MFGLTIRSIIDVTKEASNTWKRIKNFSLDIYDALNKKTLKEIKDTVMINKNLNMSNIKMKLRSVVLKGKIKNSRITINFKFKKKNDIINLIKKNMSKGKIK